jgi:hypothetical protein
MNLKEYIVELQKIYEEHGSLEIVYASDDEGNSYSNVNFDPSVIFMTEDYSIDEEDLAEYNEADIRKCVCIN